MTGKIAVFLAAAVAVAALAAGAAAEERHIAITAKRFEFRPREVVLKKDEPVVLEITATDRPHGFSVPALGVRATVAPGEPALIHITPTTVGRFSFSCDVV
ncbi:MAG: cupredoxin domain-containing protein, partial [Alphaproteobacteria bacterium]|nr:cupredoxin domain-containing protein [Alphaproteobacteria bacterium]